MDRKIASIHEDRKWGIRSGKLGRKRVLEDDTKIEERVVAPVLTELHRSWRMRDVARVIWGYEGTIGTTKDKRANTKVATIRRFYEGRSDLTERGKEG